MITITRRRARELRVILRRSALGLTRSRPAPPLVFEADGAEVRAHYRYDGLAVEHAAPDRQPAGTVALPLDALAELEGRDETPVTLEPAGPGRTRASWVDRGVPRSREYDVPTFDPPAAAQEPASWSPAATGLLVALAEAALTAGEASPRYALDCVRLGADGSISATDGRQLLVQRGFVAPGGGDAIVRLAPLFASRSLPRHAPVEIARGGGDVALRVGPWTVRLEARSGLRFPDLGDVIPPPGAAVARLRLDPGDAAFLSVALEQLPGGDAPSSPATLDLNGRVAVRARSDDGSRTVELVLARSGYSGPPTRLVTNRANLARAASLGFAEVEVGGTSAPLACRDRLKAYAWIPLSEDAAVPPSDDATRIESTTVTEPAPPPAITRKPRAEMHTRAARTPTATPPGIPTDAGGSCPATLIAEAVALHDALGDARSRAARLVGALRRERKRSRLLSSALSQLRELRLQDVAG
jgi:hypothetical protein